jgi:hypothetical protein
MPVGGEDAAREIGKLEDGAIGADAGCANANPEKATQANAGAALIRTRMDSTTSLGMLNLRSIPSSADRSAPLCHSR